jgi:hypothetical protein
MNETWKRIIILGTTLGIIASCITIFVFFSGRLFFIDLFKTTDTSTSLSNDNTSKTTATSESSRTSSEETNLPKTFNSDFYYPDTFKSTDPDNFYISEDQAILNLDRSKFQVLYRETPQFDSNLEFTVKGMLKYVESNIDMDIGLSDTNPTSAEIKNAIAVSFGYWGGGRSKQYSYICAKWIIDGVEYSTFDPDNPIEIQLGQWYTIKFSIKEGNLILDVYDDNNEIVGSTTQPFIYIFNNLRYLYLSNFDTQDWPKGQGIIDYIKIEY